MADRRTKIILGLDAGPYVRGLASASTATKAFVKELETSDSRMGNLVQTSLALGPALVPIGAAAVPAVAALTAGLGAAAGAAGVAALAFQGIGKAVTALNQYQIDPTKENLQALREAMAALGPAGREFARFIQDLRPEMQKLQDTAQAGLFPGVMDGIEQLMDRAPQVNRIIRNIAETMGDLASEAGENLAGGRFDDFFTYIETDARPILSNFGRAIGNVTEGLANMIVGFGPMSRDFSGGLLEMSRDFARWSRDLEDNEGFQAFVGYVDRVSPEALRTLGAVARALLEIVEAAAPVGEASLPIIRALANVLGAIADSPVGSILVAAAAGLAAVSRAVAVYNAANGSAIGTLFNKLSTGRRVALGAGAVGIALGDIADNSTAAGKGVNTISSALSGAAIGFGVGGPWGAAIGGAAGALLDLSAGSDSAGTSMQDTKVYAQNLANSFDQVTGAATRATRALVLEDLRKNQPNLIAGLNQIGVATRDIVGAILGQEGALKRVRKAVKESGDEWYEYGNGGRIQISGLAMLLPGLRKDFSKVREETQRNIEDTKTWRQALSGLPKRVFTELKAENFDVTFKDVKRLKEQYDLTPKQVRTIVRVLDVEKSKSKIKDFGDAVEALNPFHNTKIDTPGLEKSRGGLARLMGDVNAVPDKKDTKIGTPEMEKAQRELGVLKDRVNEVPDKKEVRTSAPGAEKAKRDIDDVAGAIRKMIGKTVGIDLSSNAKNIVTEVADAINIFNADGNVLEFYANGGMRENHVAQIAPAGANRIWAEPETGGEAYIPLAASKRTRSRAIADETVSRLGGQTIWNADGNVLVRADVGRSKVRERHPQRIDDLYAEFARSMGEKLSKEMNKVIESLTVGMHWPLPPQYSYSGTWGHYSGGGSHPALDFPAPRGTPIFSVLPGRVMHTTSLGDSYGNYTEVSHGKGLSSLYAHQQRFDTKAGERVMAGERIGFVNNTGNSFGDHLHLEMQRNGVSFDYTKALNRGASFGFPGQYEGSHEGLDRAGPPKAKAYARSIMPRYGWKPFQWDYWNDLGNRESGWRWNARNPSSGAYGIPQALPPEKMASAGSDWRTNVGTQLDWMAGYLRDVYGGPFGAIQHHNANNWYGDGGINLFDGGGLWRTGTFGLNASGRDEFVADGDLTADLKALVRALRSASRRGGLLQPIDTGRPRRGRFRPPDLERRAEREVNRAEHRVKRSDATLKNLNRAIDRAEKRLKDAEGQVEKQEAKTRIRNLEDRLDLAKKHQSRAERDLRNAKEDRRTARQDQKALDRAFKRFDLKPGMDRSEVRSEVNELIGAVKDTLGKDSRLFKALDRFRDRLQSAAKRLDEEREERRKLNDELKETRQAQRDFARTVAGNFKNDPFTGGLDEFYLQVRADRNDAQRFNRLRGRGNRLGLDGPLMKAILASGNVELLAELVRGGRGEIRKAEKAYERSRREANQLGDRAGQTVFGDEVRHLNRTINRQNRLINRLERRLERIDKQIYKGARDGTRDGQDHKKKLLQQIHVETRG